MTQASVPVTQPPNSLEAEQAVLGAALISTVAADKAVAHLVRDAFYNRAHRTIFDAVVSLRTAEPAVTVDEVTLPEELRRTEKLDVVGGPAYIATLAESVPTAADAPHYIEIIREHWIRRQLATGLADLALKAREGAEKSGEVIERAERLVHDLASKRTNGKFADGLTADRLMLMEFAPTKWIVPGLFAEGLCIIGGKGKMGKSWLLYQIAAAVALGGIALGEISVDPGRVLYLALEDTARRLKSRLDRILDGGSAPDNLHIFTRWKRMNKGGQSDLVEWFRKYPDTRLVVIDTFAKVRSVKDKPGNVYDEDYQAMSEIKQVADDHGATIVLIHHFNKMKDADDWVDSLSGSIGISGAADGIVGFFRERGRQEAVLKITGRDIDDETDKAITWTDHGGPWALRGDAAVYIKTKAQEEVISALRSVFPKPMKAGELAQAIGKSPVTVKAQLYRMVRSGTLVSSDGWFAIASDNSQFVPEDGDRVTLVTSNSSHSVTQPDGDAGDESVSSDASDGGDCFNAEPEDFEL